MVTLRYITSSTSLGRTFKFKTLVGAMRKAHKLVGSRPKRDPDGYAVNRVSGNCLFFQGVTFAELFPTPPSGQTERSLLKRLQKRGAKVLERTVLPDGRIQLICQVKA